MCTITSKKSRKRTGYKVLAVDKKGNYYSTFTGQKIGVGKVPLPPKMCDRLTNSWSDSIDDFPLASLGFYNINYVGKTAIFPLLDDAEVLFDEIREDMFSGFFKTVLVKIVLGGLVYHGRFGSTQTIASDTIKSIKQL